jgi:hypothetical protein
MYFGQIEVADHEYVGFKSIRCLFFEIFTKNDFFDNLNLEFSLTCVYINKS